MATKSKIVTYDVKSSQNHRKALTKQEYAGFMASNYKFCRFMGVFYVLEHNTWTQIDRDGFAELCYLLFGTGITTRAVNEQFNLFSTTAPRLDQNRYLILFSDGRVFDMDTLTYKTGIDTSSVFYRVQYTPNNIYEDGSHQVQFVRDIAGSDAVYGDILQGMGTILMADKPTGVIWLLGNGANGKSTMALALHKLFKGYVCDVDVQHLADPHDSPRLNGMLADVNKEGSEALITDSSIFKSAAAHESFTVQKMYNQYGMVVDGNVSYIFATNKLPIFTDKSYGLQRRNFIIRLTQVFRDDPNFNKRMLVKPTLDALLGAIIYWARIVRDRGGFQWSTDTKSQKERYDNTSNSVVAFFSDAESHGLIGALSYRHLNSYYMDWCERHGLNALSVNTLREESQNRNWHWSSRLGYSGDAEHVLVKDDTSPSQAVFDGSRWGTAWVDGRTVVDESTKIAGMSKQVSIELNSLLRGSKYEK